MGDSKGYSAKTIAWDIHRACSTRKNPGLELATGHLRSGHISTRQAMNTAQQTILNYSKNSFEKYDLNIVGAKPPTEHK